MKSEVWAITTYRRTPDLQVGPKLYRDRRTVGLFPTKDLAVALVEANGGDLEEAGWYQYAVVERLPWGLYPINISDERTWFEFIMFPDGPNEDRENGLWTPLSAAPQDLLDEYGIGTPHGPRDITNWSEVG